jgi:hypothetical protein
MAAADDDDVEMLGIKHSYDSEWGRNEKAHALAPDELQRVILPGSQWPGSRP